VMIGLVHSMNPWQGDPIRGALAKARETSGKPLLIVSPGGMPPEERATYTSRSMEVFTETDILLEGIGALLTPPPEPVPTVTATAAPALPARPLTEPESLRLLTGFGVPVVPTVECTTFDEALAHAGRIGYPVVLKGVAEGIAHKSDLGLVQVNLRDPAALMQAYADIDCPDVIVQAMVSGELEAIAGVSRAEGVGLVLLAGIGGVFAEALRDVTMWPVPVTRDAIIAGLANSSLGRVLRSPRWAHPAAEAAFIDLLLALQLAAVTIGDRLAAIDINPVILGSVGAMAVDALVVPRA
jgi:acetate---CoA ligase (ADP-forming)